MMIEEGMVTSNAACMVRVRIDTWLTLPEVSYALASKVMVSPSLAVGGIVTLNRTCASDAGGDICCAAK